MKVLQGAGVLVVFGLVEVLYLKFAFCSCVGFLRDRIIKSTWELVNPVEYVLRRE